MLDLSRLPVPNAIEPLDFETLYDAFIQRFLTHWGEERDKNPNLPAYDVETLENDPVAIIGQVEAYLRLLDRQRVNDEVKAVLAPLSSGADLDNVVVRQGLERLVVVPAVGNTPAVMESDAALFRRYLLSFERHSAGSRNCYLFHAWTAWPGMLHARVNGWREHGRKGDTDVVIIGPDGALATDVQKKLVRDAVTHPSVQPDTAAVTVINAARVEYAVDMVIEVDPGIDTELIRQEAEARVRNAAAVRMFIGGEIPAGYLAGAAYGASVVRVRDHAPVVIAANVYAVPVLTACNIAVEVRS